MSKIIDVLNTIAQRIGFIDDYIVETGTSGIWVQTKYASGKSECYGTFNKMLTHYSGPYADLFYGYTTSVDFPPQLFICRPAAVYGCRVGSGFSMPGTNLGIDKDNISLFVLAGSSGLQDCTFDIHVKGLWK